MLMRPMGRARPRPATPKPWDGVCTRDTQRCPNAKSYHAELAPCCRGHVRQIMVDAIPLLAEHGVTWWADYGTLLGAVRNPLTTKADYPWLWPDVGVNGEVNAPLAPGIVPHDKDGDVGVLGVHWAGLMRVRAAMERLGYQVGANPHGLKMKVRLSPVNTTNVDFFCWRPKRGGVLYRPKYINVDHYKGRDFKIEDAFPLTTVEWEGLTIPAPRNPEAFCEFRYGPGWKTPIPANHDGRRR